MEVESRPELGPILMMIEYLTREVGLIDPASIFFLEMCRMSLIAAEAKRRSPELVTKELRLVWPLP
ncbi:MAG: hypothetical protein WCB34_06970 [Methylovirgula sp.]